VVLVLAADGRAQDDGGKPKEPESLFATNRLLSTDPVDKHRSGCHYKSYQFKMISGKQYHIDMTARGFNCYLRLEDMNGQRLAESSGAPTVRMNFGASTATFRIIASSVGPRETGSFNLRVAPEGFVPTPGAIRWEGTPDAGEDIAVDVQSDNTMSFTGQNDEAHGYLETQFTIVNYSPTTSHEVTLSHPVNKVTGTYGWKHFVGFITRSVKVKPRSVMSGSLFQPNLPISGGGVMGVAIDGKMTAQSGLNFFHHNRGDRWGRSAGLSPGTYLARTIMTSSGVRWPLQNNIWKAAVGQRPRPGSNPPGNAATGWLNGKSYTYVHQNALYEVQTPIRSQSRHWLGYSRYDGMVLTSAELGTAPPEVLIALWHYVESGGCLLVAGAYPVPAAWEKTRQDRDGLASYYPGFGQCLVVREPDINKWEPRQWRYITAMWQQVGRPWHEILSPDGANRRLPVVAEQRVPVRSLFLVMLVFAVLIGPVNIWALSRQKRRIWLLWTVPAFSLFTCAAVVAFMTFTEGWQARVRADGMTILDETTGRATSIGWLGVYSPSTLTDGIHVSRDAELTQHLAAPSYTSEPPRVLDWTNDQHLVSGWLTARIPAHFLVRCNEPRRERLQVSREQDGRLVLVNGLGATIRTLWLADAEGKIYKAADIPSGGKAALILTGDKAANEPARIHQAYCGDWLYLVDTLSAEPETYLRPRCYIAVLEAAPFLPRALDSAASDDSRSVVFGIRNAP
jgi:hypothetical protein